jgi:hypothetical protein
MLYVRKDLASKYTDWRGVERGAKRRPSKCLELQKPLASFGIFGSGLPLRSRPLNAST